ncbi:VWA domain-containing protein [Azospirillum isscasi]|uniref:VWA domain-containing protein n=1 Tax=Azospirillum isscasi TaxID=3053926 RepID=A0ABU0WJ89_9PROT|nr:VWA domain-containing protein [Azospirillum isscasi]MDQ2104278.1 VWA domain-containing protein [Azospirillum isscasi]
MGERDHLPAQQRSTQTEVDDFLRRVAALPRTAAGPRGRLMFAMDATASREPTWDRACRIQGEMFQATAALGGLDIQLVYYRGFRECQASPWVGNSQDLLRRMTAVACMAGQTQIGRVLAHCLKQTRDRKVNALVFVGDCMEEDIDQLAHQAGQLGLLGVPAFMFHERGDLIAKRAFQTIARLSGGAYCPFDGSSAQQLRDLLSAVAVYAAGGRAALVDYSRGRGDAVRLLTSQIGHG